MRAGERRVVRSDLWIDPAFDERLSREQGSALAVFPVRGDPALVWDLLVGAHVYHVSAAKDELPREWCVGPDLIGRCPHLVCVSSSGAGYDTVDVAACTAAGIAVVNPAGGNAPSVAEHALGLMLGGSRRMGECDRRMRRETGYSREQVMGHEIRGKTLGLVGIGHIPHRRRDARGPAQHRQHRRRTDRRGAGGRASAAPRQPRGLAGVRAAQRPHPSLSPPAFHIRASGARRHLPRGARRSLMRGSLITGAVDCLRPSRCPQAGRVDLVCYTSSHRNSARQWPAP
jgi:hypothetical protein